MITEDLFDTTSSYASVYLQSDISLTADDEDVAEVLATLLRKYSVGHKRTGGAFAVHAQKVTLDGENLVAFMAILHDNDVDVSPNMKLEHRGERRFDLVAVRPAAQ